MRTGESQRWKGSSRRLGAIGGCVATAAAAALLPAAAAAVPSCNFATPPTAAVTVTSGDVATVSRSAGGAIEVGGVPCGAATVTTTDTITITDTGAVGVTVFINLNNGGFVPGLTDEPADTSDEIEFRVDLGTGTGADSLVVDGAFDIGGDNIRSGAGGINLNAGEATGDADVTNPASNAFPAGVESVSVLGNPGNDTLSAGGLAGTGAAATVPHLLTGDAGIDSLLGGAAGDTMRGGEDNDTLGGGGGVDTADYSSADGPTSINLNFAGPQSIGADQDTDTLDGTTIEVLRGGGFGDSLTGRDGTDTIEALGGDDSVFDRDGAADVIDCGDDQDTVTTDAAGVDSLTACETQLFPALPIPTPPATPATPAAPAVAVPNPACTALRAQLKKAKTKKRKRGLRARLRKLGC